MIGLAQNISDRLQTTSVIALMGDDAESGIFAIFENGQRRFWCKREIHSTGDDLKEVVQTQGDTWATAQGFKPAEGFAKFRTDDANDLTRHLGFKLEHRPDPEKFLVLRKGSLRPVR